MQRIDGTKFGRLYEVKEKVFYKSYTTVLGCMPPSQFFLNWLRNKTKEESDKLMREAGDSGTKIHHTIDLMNKKQAISPNGMTDEQLDILLVKDKYLRKILKRPYTIEEDKKLRGYFKWVEKYNPIHLKAEFTVFSDKLECAGTVDELCEISLGKKNKKGRKKTDVVLTDYKTGNVYESGYRQVAGYFMAMKEMVKKKHLEKEYNPTEAYILHLNTTKEGYKFIKVDVKKHYKGFCRTEEEWRCQNPKFKSTDEPKVYNFLKEYKI